MPHKTRSLIVFIMILALGLAFSFWGTQPAAAITAGIDPSLKDAPGGVVTGGTLQEGFQMTYTVTVFNNGDTATSSAFTLTVDLPQHVNFNTSSSATFGACTGNGGTPETVTCTGPATLAAGASATVTITVDLKQLSAGNKVTNVSITGGGDVNTANNAVAVNTSIAGSPDLTLTKQHNGSFFSVGNAESYQFVVTNNGSAASSTSVKIFDQAGGANWPAGLDYSSASGTGWTCIKGAQLICSYSATIGSFGSSNPLTVNVSPNAGAPASLTNTAEVQDTSEPVPFQGNNTASDTVTVKPAPNITVSMVANPASFAVGATGQKFDLTVTNTGGDTFAPITVSGNLPANMTFVAAGSGGNGFTCSAAGQTVTCTRNSQMLAAATATFSIPVNVTAATPNPATYIVNATTTGQGTPNTGSVTVNIATVTLAMTKAAFNAPFLVDATGATLQGYIFSVTNNGTGPTFGVITVTDNLPAGLTFVSGGGGAWSCAGTAVGATTVTCTNAGPLGAGSTDTNLKVNVKVANTVGASVTNTGANATTNGSPTAIAPDVVTNVNAPDLTITKTHSDPFTANSQGTYTITVKNSGTGSTTSAISVVDNLPSGFTFNNQTGSDPGWAACTGTTSVTCNFAGPLAAGAQAVLKLTVTPTSGGLAGTPNGTCPSTATGVINCAIASNADESAAAATNNKVWDPTNVNNAPAPDVTISQNYAPNPIPAGSTATLTLTVSNVGNLATTAGTTFVTDNLPAGFTVTTPVTSAGWDCSASSAATINCFDTGAGIAPGSSFPNITATITAPLTPNTYNNTAHAQTTGDGFTGNDTNTIGIVVSAALVPDLAVTKTHPVGFIRNTAGNFVITVNNVGGANTDNTKPVQITDNLPANFTYNSGGDDPSDGTGLGTWTCPAPPPPPVGSSIVCNMTGQTVTPGGHYKRLLINVTPTVVGTTFVNSVTITTPGAPPGPGGEINFTNDSATDPSPVTAAAAPDLTVTMTNSNNFVEGGVSSFTINVTNSGSGPTNAASPIKVTDTLPAGFDYVNSGSNLSGGSGWTCPAESPGLTSVVCTYVAGAVPAGTTLNALTIFVRPTASGSVTNTAAVAAVTGEALTTNNSASNTVNVAGAFDIKITKVHSPANFALGAASGTNFYTITVTNIGSVDTPLGKTITVTDPLDGNLGPVTVNTQGGGFVCSPANPVTTPATLTCILNSQLTHNGGTQTITIHADNILSSGSFPKNFTNTAHVAIQAGTTETNLTNNDASDPTTITNGPQADLKITSAHTDPFTVGQTGTYTITVQNVGTASFTGPVSISDLLPPGVSYTSFTSVGPGTWTCAAPGTCNLASTTLGINASSVVQISVNVVGPAGSGANTVSITTGAPGDPNPSNNTNSDTTNIVTLPPISPTLSTVCVSNATGLLADNSSQALVVVTVKNTSGTLQTGQSVLLNTSGIPVTITPSNPINSNGGGTASFFVTTGTPGTVHFTATVNGVVIGPSSCGSQATFNSTTGLSVASSTVTANPAAPATIAADGVATGTVTVHVVDNSSNPVNGAGVTLSYTTNTGNTTGIVPASGSTLTTITNGNAVFTLTSTTNQTLTFTATATFNGQTITLSQHPQMIFGNGGTSGSGTVTLTLSTNYISIPADNITTATITANIKDSSGNGISGKTITLAGAPVLDGMTISPASAVTDASGNASFTIRSTTQGGPVTFTATDTTDSLTFPTVEITFTAPGTAPVAAPNATATPGGTAGTTTTGTVIVRLMCIRTGPGFGYSRYDQPIKFGTIVTVLGKTTRVPGIAARDGCIHVGGPTWLFIVLPDSSVAWANANLIRIGSVAFRALPVLAAPPAPGQPGAGQAATTGIAGEPPKK